MIGITKLTNSDLPESWINFNVFHSHQPNQHTLSVNHLETFVAGQSIFVTWTVSNTGVGPTREDAWTDQMYLSSSVDSGKSNRLPVAHIVNESTVLLGQVVRIICMHALYYRFYDIPTWEIWTLWSFGPWWQLLVHTVCSSTECHIRQLHRLCAYRYQQSDIWARPGHWQHWHIGGNKQLLC